MKRLTASRYAPALRAKKLELLKNITELRSSMAVAPESDPMDQYRDLAGRDVAVQQLDRWCRFLHQVDDALDKVEAGRFGVCEECGRAIPPGRLRTVPWAPYCVACQERLEESGAAA